MNTYIGIDPGVNGGIWFVNDQGGHGGQKCPETIKDMEEVLSLYIEEGMSYAVIEAVHSMPGQSAPAMFKFAKNYGVWLGLLAGFEVPYIQVSPQKWMKHFGAMPAKKPGERASKHKTRRKNHLKHLAQQRFPHFRITLNTADAALLATYSKEFVWHGVKPMDMSYKSPERGG